MDDLIRRIEEAGEGSRELDVEIARLLSNSVESDDGDFWWGPHTEPLQRVPDFTTSIDAALELRDKDKFPMCVIQDMGDVMGVSARLAVIDTTGVEPQPIMHDGQAATIPLALCAASLRARKEG